MQWIQSGVRINLKKICRGLDTVKWQWYTLIMKSDSDERDGE